MSKASKKRRRQGRHPAAEGSAKTARRHDSDAGSTFPIELSERQLIWFACGLALLSLFAYWPSLSNDFIADWDDAVYVSENPKIMGGLSAEGVTWALTHSHSANWHPLTWLSHMVDAELYAANPRGHHLTSMLLHAANVLLLVLALLALFPRREAAGEDSTPPTDSGRLWKIAVVAAIFALHPLRVESVSWISERKDVLSASFFFLTLLGYGRYVQQRSSTRFYAGVALPMALGLMAKPMLVSLPLVLLLLDYWPLRRMGQTADGAAGQVTGAERLGLALWIEKLPLFALALASAGIALVTQSGDEAVSSASHVLPSARVASAFVAYQFYLEKLFWPADLAAFYPRAGDVYPGAQLWHLALPGMGLFAAALALSIAMIRRAPYLAVGLGWQLVMLLPVIGIVVVGAQGYADRYSYLTLIGPSIALVWGVADLLRLAPTRYLSALRMLVCLLVAAGVVAGVVATRAQVRTWKDSQTLWRAAFERVPRNYLAALKLSELAYRSKQLPAALELADAADRMVPDWPKTQYLRGIILAAMGEHSRARTPLERALVAFDFDARLHSVLGMGALAEQDWGRAAEHLERAVALSPSDVGVAFNLAKALAALGRVDEALPHLERASAQRPDDMKLRLLVAEAYERAGRREPAAEVYREILARSPNDARAASGLERVSGLPQ